VLVPDRAGVDAALAARLPAAEWARAAERPTARARRQFLLGRLAAQAAIRQALGRRRGAAIEVVSGARGQPLVHGAGTASPVAVSLSHAGRLAAACAWRTAPPRRTRAGIDLERVRPSDVATSRYAFSRGERRLVGRQPARRAVSALAAWTAKEAAWKALCPDPSVGPAALEIRALRLASGRGLVRVRAPCRRLGPVSALRVRVSSLHGPDGGYLLSLAVGLTGPVLPSARLGQVGRRGRRVKRSPWRRGADRGGQ
jgi:phosphopantetheinyl transferase